MNTEFIMFALNETARAGKNNKDLSAIISSDSTDSEKIYQLKMCILKYKSGDDSQISTKEEIEELTKGLTDDQKKMLEPPEIIKQNIDHVTDLMSIIVNPTTKYNNMLKKCGVILTSKKSDSNKVNDIVDLLLCN